MKGVPFFISAVVGLMLLAAGILIPVHLRAVDAGVIRSAGEGTPALLKLGQMLAGDNKLGAAQMLVQAARLAEIPGWDRLNEIVTNRAQQNPDGLFWGDDARTENFFGSHFDPSTDPSGSGEQALAGFMVQQKSRETALAHMQDSQAPGVQEVLRCRSLDHTLLFPSSQSAAGQAFDTAVAICGLLLDGKHLTAKLSNNILLAAAAANGGGDSEPIEQVLMDFLSLGERFNWDQLTAFVEQIQDTDTLHQLAVEARNMGDRLPVLFATVQLSGNPAEVVHYANRFKQTGFQDFTASLRYGAGGVNELAREPQRFYRPNWEQQITAFNPFGGFYDATADLSFRRPALALAAKWLCYLLAGFLFAGGLHSMFPATLPLERPLQVRGFHLIRKFLFSAGFLLMVLLLSEPFLAQEDQLGNFSLRPHLPTAGDAVHAEASGIKQTIMNPTILITLSIFFVLQALIYIACLVKLAEIRRQEVPARMKLKLLENEDHLFDAGLYLGFVGTIASLIIASLGMVHFSLMAAYSSTSFGIIFVVIFKIFHLRPARRKLLLQAELEAEAAAPKPYPPIATRPSVIAP